VADAAPATRRASGLARALGSAAFTRALRGPWLFIGVVVAGILLVALAGARLTGLPFPQFRPALPAPSDVDPAFYAIVMPEPSAPPGFSVSPALIATLKVSRYTTRAGDSLSRIAARFKLNVDTVVSWNGIRDARAISAGTVLDIPNSDGLKYVVRRGDTLQGIARAQGVDFNSVLDWNRLATSVITVGQELFLPGARLNSTELNRILGSLFMYPVQGRISSWFGERAEPFTGVPSFHNGIDIVNAPGTPILAAMAGEVADLGFNRSYGYYVILKHSGQYQTLYGHLTRSVVTRGQKVRQGEKIGELGTTGVSTGPHLHFSVFKNGQPVDPLRFLT
jgi:murein DD-endopeptidase MepM/ murein hydrolase activator NlpD